MKYINIMRICLCVLSCFLKITLLPQGTLYAINPFYKKTLTAYANKNDKGETPAMPLGLAKGPVAIEKILYFGKYE